MISSKNLFLKRNGDVRSLRVYKVSVIISMATEFFIKRFLDPHSRTCDQMRQAARSCKQNIVEGSNAAATSKETEIKLTNVALASLSELKEDYIDFLRFNSLNVWGVDNPRIEKLRDYLQSDKFELECDDLCGRMSAEEYCNLMITLISQEEYLLRKLIMSMESRFVEEGGIREQMSKARIEFRKDNRK